FLQKYYAELECMFYDWGFGQSIKMLLQQGYTLTKDEMRFFKEIMLQLFPEVRTNTYVRERKNGWDTVLHAILDTEPTDEAVQRLNELLKTCA
ncbi:MAG: hypothetical protein NC489_27785, partial [Ruminococcus flavefaciens]|nr:hypothetical protein [Ruminococcus flavefaciens]